MLTGAEPAAPPSSADPSTAPSFPAGDVGCARPPPKAAFCFTGQPRTFIHPEAQRSIVRALKSFGADAYTFFVLTDDDPGSSYHHPSIRSSGDGVRAAMAALRPKFASYAPLEAGAAGYANERRVACGMKEEGVTHAIGSRYFMQTFYESHFKLRTCYEEVERYEGTHRFAFDWVVRMRPDVWFWAPMPLPHCRLRQDAVTFPAGVVGCSYAPCINDHIAYLPRRHAAPYFTIASDMRSCAGVRNLSLHWKNYNVWRLMGQSVPLAAPSFFFRTRCCARAPTRRSNRTTPSASAGARRRLKRTPASPSSTAPPSPTSQNTAANAPTSTPSATSAPPPGSPRTPPSSAAAASRTSATPAGRAGRSHSLRRDAGRPRRPRRLEVGDGSKRRRRCRARSFSTGSKGRSRRACSRWSTRTVR